MFDELSEPSHLPTNIEPANKAAEQQDIMHSLNELKPDVMEIKGKV